MIKLRISFNSLEKVINEKIKNAEELCLIETEPKTFKKKFLLWENDVINFLQKNIINIPEELISNIKYPRGENDLWGERFIENKKELIQALKKKFLNKIDELKTTFDYLKTSDILKENRKAELYSVDDKINFILQKLYDLYDSDKFYSISLILKVNEIKYRNNEPEEIANNLHQREYGILKDNWSNSDYLKISVKGATYLERKNKKNKKDCQIKEMNLKIDKIILTLQNLGYGQEIIFEEIEELRTLSKSLSKKTLSQVIKGKVIDLTLSQIINKETASLIYESLVGNEFKTLK